MLTNHSSTAARWPPRVLPRLRSAYPEPVYSVEQGSQNVTCKLVPVQLIRCFIPACFSIRRAAGRVRWTPEIIHSHDISMSPAIHIAIAAIGKLADEIDANHITDFGIGKLRAVSLRVVVVKKKVASACWRPQIVEGVVSERRMYHTPTRQPTLSP